MENTTIQVSKKLLEELKSRKLFDRESYEDIIQNLLEDSKQLNAETRMEIEQARAEIKAGRYYSLEEVRVALKR